MQDLSSLPNVMHKAEDKKPKSSKAEASSSKIHAIYKSNLRPNRICPLHPGGYTREAREDLTARFIQAHGNDFDLLDRDTIKEISVGKDGQVETKKREKKFLKIMGQRVAHGANLLVKSMVCFA